MGIKNLNAFFRDNCKKSIYQIPLRNLKNKRVVVDISIYLYKFMSDDALLENVYLMISIFRDYNIKPLFVFDGPPPKEKLPLLALRKEAKKNAESSMQEIRKNMDSEEDYKVKQEMAEQIDQLKKKCIKIHSRDINKVKKLMDAYGVNYVEAPGEADELCAQLVIKDEAYACISEDMDMFVYGCPRVLRYFSILKKTGIMYNFKHMMTELEINATEFRQICVSSGTDYNSEHIPLFKILNTFKKYRIKNNDENIDFLKWITSDTKYFNNTSIDELRNIENMFKNLSITTDNMRNFNNTIVDTAKIHEIMSDEGFIFPNSPRNL